MEGIDLGSEALHSLEIRRDAIASNLASRAPGTKSTVVAQEGIGSVPSSFGGMISIPQVKLGIDFNPGTPQKTGSPTDVALLGEKTLFSVDGGKLYTRDGEFHWDASGKLVTKQGLSVDGKSGEITKLPGGGEISIDSHGNIFQGSQLINKLAVFEFSGPESLTQVPGGFVPSDFGGGLSPSEYFEVAPESIERSNNSSIHSMTELIKISSAYTANQKVIQQMDERYAQAVAYLSR